MFPSHRLNGWPQGVTCAAIFEIFQQGPFPNDTATASSTSSSAGVSNLESSSHVACSHYCPSVRKFELLATVQSSSPPQPATRIFRPLLADHQPSPLTIMNLNNPEYSEPSQGLSPHSHTFPKIQLPIRSFLLRLAPVRLPKSNGLVEFIAWIAPSSM